MLNTFFVFISSCIDFWILLCFFLVKLIWKTKYTIWCQVITTTPTCLGEFFKTLLFVLQKEKIYALFFVCISKRSLSFLILVYFVAFFYRVASVLWKQLSPCFQLSDRSRLPFWLVFNPLLNNLIIFPQMFIWYWIYSSIEI